MKLTTKYYLDTMMCASEKLATTEGVNTHILSVKKDGSEVDN